ncbi:MAG: hypothetical protein U0414_38450 [Polyangiaceae bacterium]
MVRGASLVVCIASVSACSSSAGGPIQPPTAWTSAPTSSVSTPAPAAAADPLAVLAHAADIEPDPAFAEFVQTHKQDLPAPRHLRQLLLRLDVVRMDFYSGFTDDGGRMRLAWGSTELGMRGAPDAALARFAAIVEPLGLAPSSSEGSKHTWTATREGVTERVTIDRLAPWMGGRESACGAELSYELEVAAPRPSKTLREVLTTFPHLRLAAADASIYDGLADQAVFTVDVGGTWTRFYEFSLTVEAASNGRIAELLGQAGYQSRGHDRDYETLHRESTGSFAYLHDPDARGHVELSLQPYSS